MLIRVLAILFFSGFAAKDVAAAQLPANGRSEDVALGPGDVVRILVWREPDLSGDFIIDELGIVTLPMVGRVDVRDVPVSQVRDKLMTAYVAQLRNPSVTITPLRRVYVLGEVNKPGLYTADPTLSLAGVLALAGGATSTGDVRRIRLVRNGSVVQTRVDPAASLVNVNIRSQDQIFVDRRPWTDRNSALLGSAAISAVTLVLSVLIR
ncbi:MAG TPA: polysaccharide biosynthesis/export family protein [Gemmatimonadaceae bacterium]|jgi:polysaccharide export outer membrane protein